MLSAGAIAGIVIGAIVVLVLLGVGIGLAVYFIIRRRREQGTSSSGGDDSGGGGGSSGGDTPVNPVNPVKPPVGDCVPYTDPSSSLVKTPSSTETKIFDVESVTDINSFQVLKFSESVGGVFFATFDEVSIRSDKGANVMRYTCKETKMVPSSSALFEYTFQAPSIAVRQYIDMEVISYITDDPTIDEITITPVLLLFQGNTTKLSSSTGIQSNPIKFPVSFQPYRVPNQTTLSLTTPINTINGKFALIVNSGNRAIKSPIFVYAKMNTIKIGAGLPS